MANRWSSAVLVTVWLGTALTATAQAPQGTGGVPSGAGNGMFPVLPPPLPGAGTGTAPGTGTGPTAPASPGATATPPPGASLGVLPNLPGPAIGPGGAPVLGHGPLPPGAVPLPGQAPLPPGAVPAPGPLPPGGVPGPVPPTAGAAAAPAAGPGTPDTMPPGMTLPVDSGPQNAFECVQPPCNLPPCWHFGVEYIHWWLKKPDVPTDLLTTGSINDAVPGALGQPNTRVIYGGSSPGSSNAFNGIRLSAAYDFDPAQICGADASFFILGSRSSTASFASSGAPGSMLLARPFYNVNAMAQDADPVTIPGVVGGTISFTTVQRFYGADADFRGLLYGSPYTRARVFGLAGLRYLNLEEKLFDNEYLNDIPGQGATGNTYTLNENFTAFNSFIGGQLGLQGQFCFGPFTMDLIGKVALGPNFETVKIGASTEIMSAGGGVATATNQALLVQTSNAGNHYVTSFAVAPEGRVRFGFDLTDHLRLTAGYTFLYISRVAQPGNQIDHNVNVQPIGPTNTGPPAPSLFSINQSTFWAQGFDLGLQFNF